MSCTYKDQPEHRNTNNIMEDEETSIILFYKFSHIMIDDRSSEIGGSP